MQGLLREPESKEVVAEGTEVATNVLPQELAQEALRMLQVCARCAAAAGVLSLSLR